MATEGTAVQYLAVQLVEAPNPRARMALVTEVSPLVENLIGGMEHCPIADDPMFLEIWKSCDKAQRFMDYFTHWFYQQEAFPPDLCVREPDLLSMTDIPRLDPLVAPPWVARINASMAKIRSAFKQQTLANQMIWTDSLKNVAAAASTLAEKLQWPMLRTFGRDLGRMMSEIGWPSIRDD